MARVTRKAVLSVSLGVAITMLACVSAGVWFFMNHRDSLPVSADIADAEFSRLRAHFAGQQPLVDMARREPVDGSIVAPLVAPLHTFHTVVFDTRGGSRLVHITVPYWFGRLFAGRSGEFRWLGQLTFLDDTEFDPEAISLRLDRLERHGPGLVADYRHPAGGQFISWVE